MSSPPTSRLVSINMTAIYEALDAKRQTERITWTEVGRRAGLKPTARAWMTRLSNGAALRIHTIAALLVWLGDTDLAPYLHIRKEHP